MVLFSCAYALNENLNQEFIRKIASKPGFCGCDARRFFSRYISNPSADLSILEKIFEISNIYFNHFAVSYTSNPNAKISLLQKLLVRPELDVGAFIRNYRCNANADKDFLERLNNLQAFS